MNGVYCIVKSKRKRVVLLMESKQHDSLEKGKAKAAMQHKKEDCPSRLKSVFFWHHQYPLVLSFIFRLSFLLFTPSCLYRLDIFAKVRLHATVVLVV